MNKWLPSLFNRERSSEIGDPFTALQTEINRLFEDVSHWQMPRLMSGAPRLDMSETDKTLEIEVELPGMTDKDVELLVEEDRLVLRGKSDVEREDKQRDYHVKERISGAFERRLTLPFRPDASKIKAKYDNGILQISIEKTEEAKSTGTKVPIQMVS